ncbi:MAG: HAD family phosphatase [Lachnospiraceae bacterium]|nr:HAD family phosphatase [Lachnospiraceae bacterium]
MNTIIFDIGNVLVDFDWPSFVKRTVKSEEAIRLLNKVLWEDELWKEMDRGAFAEGTVRRELISACKGFETIAEEVYARLGETLELFPYTEDWLRELKQKGYRLLYLSNYSHYMIRKKPEVLAFTRLMDGGIYSCDVKLLKPDLEIYDRLTKAYDLEPSKCLFLDDRFINVAGAREYGFFAMQFTTFQEMKPKIDAFLAEHLPPDQE